MQPPAPEKYCAKSNFILHDAVTVPSTGDGKKSVWFPFLFNLAYEKRDTKQNLLEIIAAHSRICFGWTKYQLQRGQRGPAVTTEKEWDICNALLTLSGSA